MKAADLLKGKLSPLPVPAAALDELRKLVQHNDAVPAACMRVSAAKAIELLQSYGVPVVGRGRLNRICREHLSRRSYGTK